MNRPIKENFKGHLDNNCWVSKHVEYLEELEKYCDELVDLSHENRLRIEKLDRALDIACEILAEGYGWEYASYRYVFPDERFVTIPSEMNPEQWRMWLVTGNNDE